MTHIEQYDEKKVFSCPQLKVLHVFVKTSFNINEAGMFRCLTALVISSLTKATKMKLVKEVPITVVRQKFDAFVNIMENSAEQH